MKRSAEQFQVDELFKRLARLGYEPHTSCDGREDRPDFVLTIGGQLIGLETTTCVCQELVRVLDLQHSEELADCWLAITNLKDGKTRRSKHELVREVLNPESEWKNTEFAMREWGEKIAGSLNDKRTKLNNSGFRQFPQNWLLIFDFPPLGNDVLTHELACQQMLSVFSKRADFHNDFSSVFVLSGHYLFRWSDRKLSLHHDQRKA